MFVETVREMVDEDRLLLGDRPESDGTVESDGEPIKVSKPNEEKRKRNETRRSNSPAISAAQEVLLIHHGNTIDASLLIRILLLPQPLPPPLDLTRTLSLLPGQPVLPLLLLLDVVVLCPNSLAPSSSSEHKLRLLRNLPKPHCSISRSSGDEVLGSEGGEGVGGVLVTEEGFEMGEGGEGEDGDGSIQGGGVEG